MQYIKQLNSFEVREMQKVETMKRIWRAITRIPLAVAGVVLLLIIVIFNREVEVT